LAQLENITANDAGECFLFISELINMVRGILNLAIAC